MFEILEHPADIGIRAEGRTFAEALEQSVAGLAAIATGGRPVAGGDTRPVEVSGSPEEQVIAVLEECLFLIDADGWIAGGATLSVDGQRVVGTLAGELFDRERHEHGVHVKAITWHQLSVSVAAERCQIVVYVDI